ncbi:MAG: AAA family ATPase [Anaerolineales bacterium]|nr:AAA family ATPase [Anaerolineales bacterium]
MQCPICGTNNPAQARFCMECGALLVNGVVCSNCHTLLPSQARFCYHCGEFLSRTASMTLDGAATAAKIATPQAIPVLQQPPPAPIEAEAPPPSAMTLGQLPPKRLLHEMLPSLQRYLPQSIYEPLERRPNQQQLEQARDHLAALLETTKTYLPRPVVDAPQPAGQPAGGMYRGVFLFGDVSGFTPLSEKLKQQGQAGAEQITQLINSLFTELVKVLFSHGGDLLKFGGDALLGLFPADTDEEMAAGALRAVQAGMAMQEVMKQERFAAIRVGEETRALKIKCGVSAGPYFAAHIGTQKIMAYVTTGHTVNHAEQAEGHANPDDVVITQNVYDLIASAPGFEVGPPEKEPEDGYYLVRRVPEASGHIEQFSVAEPPEGETLEQITYLVERMDRLSPYLSDELIARIVTNPGNPVISPEHRPVTVMFVNYVGISDLIEDMGDTHPELIVEHLNNYFVHMAEVVERYEGTLARMDQYAIGDRLVIFFGAPRAHEDDPVRAVYTALEMQQATNEYFAALQTSSGVYRFRQRAGINTGILFAGNAGAPNLRQEYTLMGDDINMAARLMSNAGWDEIYTSKKTQERVAAFIDLEDKGELKVKGKQIRIPTFKALGRRGEVGQVRGLEMGESPLTGREQPLDGLKQCVQGLLSGRGQVVSIIGNSGLGKSRLTREMKRWLFAQEGECKVRWLDGYALSFSEQMSYWLAGQIIRGALGLRSEARQEDVLYMLWEHSEELLGKLNAREAVPFLANLLGLELKSEWAAWVKDLDPRVRQKQTFWAAREFFIAEAHRQPLLIVLDDLHWADEASLTLLEELLSITDQAPVMFCFIYRPVRQKGAWRLRDKANSDFHHRYTEIELSPLTKKQSRELLTRLLPGADFSDELIDRIFEKSTGNPFYLEEVVRSLISDGAVLPVEEEADHLDALIHKVTRQPTKEKRQTWRVDEKKIKEISVPDTLQSAIISRIDRLTEDARQALQMAAVIGRQFRLEILRNLTQQQARIDTWLAQLERGGLIQPLEITANPTYAFPDALVQEVAYDSLLVQSRRRLHRQIGETLEVLFADDLEQTCELLAYHFNRSDDQERALKYLETAAKKAKSEYANETAIQYYEEILGIRREQSDLAGQSSARYAMGVIAYEIGDYERARSWLQESAALLAELGDTQNQAWSLMYLGMVDLKQANYARAAEYHTSAMNLAQQRGDTFQEGIHLTNLARVSMRLGQYDLALQQFGKSLEMKRQMKDLTGMGFASFYQGLIFIYQDHLDQAEAALGAAIEAWKQTPKNERVVSYYHHGMGLLSLVQGQFPQAQEHLQKACELSNKLVLKAENIENLSALSQAKLGLGETETAVELSSQALRLLEEQKDVEEVQQIYLNHHRVLAASENPAAAGYLQKAYETMMNRAKRIENEETRRSYLEQVRVNREIAALLQKAGRDI